MLYYIRVQFFYQKCAFVDYLHHLYGSVGLDGVAIGQGLIFPDRFVDGDLHLSFAFALPGDGQIDPAGAADRHCVDVDVATGLHLCEQTEQIHYDRHQRYTHQGCDDDQERLRLHAVFKQDGCPAKAQDEVDEVAESVEIDSPAEVAAEIGCVHVEVGSSVHIRAYESEDALDDENERRSEGNPPEDLAQNAK